MTDTGKLKNFTGQNSPGEVPTEPGLHLDTASRSGEEAANRVINWLRDRGTVR